MTTSIPEISVSELAVLNESNSWLLLDVREPWEIELAAIKGALCIPMHQVPEQLEQLDSSKTIYVMCHHGGRSLQVAQFLSRHGYSDVFNITGGIHAWSIEIDSSITTY